MRAHTHQAQRRCPLRRGPGRQSRHAALSAGLPTRSSPGALLLWPASESVSPRAFFSSLRHRRPRPGRAVPVPLAGPRARGIAACLVSRPARRAPPSSFCFPDAIYSAINLGRVVPLCPIPPAIPTPLPTTRALKRNGKKIERHRQRQQQQQKRSARGGGRRWSGKKSGGTRKEGGHYELETLRNEKRGGGGGVCRDRCGGLSVNDDIM